MRDWSVTDTTTSAAATKIETAELGRAIRLYTAFYSVKK
jgi:hypothetical protein